MSLDSANYLNLDCLIRVPLSNVRHRNEALVGRLKSSRIQVYKLENTNFICMISAINTSIWASFEYSEIPTGRVIVPKLVLSFDELMEVCPSKELEPLLFHLDVFAEKC